MNDTLYHNVRTMSGTAQQLLDGYRIDQVAKTSDRPSHNTRGHHRQCLVGQPLNLQGHILWILSLLQHHMSVLLVVKEPDHDLTCSSPPLCLTLHTPSAPPPPYMSIWARPSSPTHAFEMDLGQRHIKLGTQGSLEGNEQVWSMEQHVCLILHFTQPCQLSILYCGISLFFIYLCNKHSVPKAICIQ